VTQSLGSRILIIAALLILPAIAWWGVFDGYADRYVQSALTNAGLIYGTARGINALVSVLQGTEVDVFMLSLSVGELLDPLNDLIERFSGVMMFALGALALQKILLMIVTNVGFNITLTALAVASAVFLLVKAKVLADLSLRSFIVVAFLRFSFGLVVLANTWIDVTFLSKNEEEFHDNMKSLLSDLREITTLVGLGPPTPEAMDATRRLIGDLDEEIAAQETDLLALQQKQAIANAALKNLCPSWYSCVMKKPEGADQAKQDLDRIEAQIDNVESAIRSFHEERSSLEKRLACMEAKAAGESCGFLNDITSTVSSAQLSDSIEKIQAKTSEVADNAISLLMSLLLKAVAIPLGFLYVLLNLTKSLWRSTAFNSN